MSLFPLDGVRNARPRQQLEPALQELRTAIAAFQAWEATGLGQVEEVLEAFDQARPRLNVLASLLLEAGVKAGADISTGLGFLPVLLQRLGFQVTATEAEPEVSRFACRQGIAVRALIIGRDALPFPPASLDFLVLGEVLEHLHLPPAQTIASLAPALRPGGLLLLTTPNITRLGNLERLAAGESILEAIPSDLPPGADLTRSLEHVREYSVREVVEAVEEAGLGIEQVLLTGWGESGYHPRPNPYSNDLIVVRATR